MFKRFICVSCGPVPKGCLGTVCQPCRNKLIAERIRWEEILREQNSPRHRAVRRAA